MLSYEWKSGIFLFFMPYNCLPLILCCVKLLHPINTGLFNLLLVPGGQNENLSAVSQLRYCDHVQCILVVKKIKSIVSA